MSPYQKKKIREYFSCIKVNDYIYAGTLKSKVAISMDVAYKILEYIKKEGYITNIYEIYCFDCDHTKKFISSITQFKDNTYCDCCGKKLEFDNNIVVLYKVIKV